MPRYFFDVHDGTFARDEEGVILDSLNAARKQVWTTLPAVASQREAMAIWPSSCEWMSGMRLARTSFMQPLAFVIEPAAS
jgi:hypothetical protein